MTSLKKEFNGARWFVEGDIKGCFDNIDHAVLVGLLNGKIKDARIIKLVYEYLKAGYMENWQYHSAYSGTPQGGIISPLLANIYLEDNARIQGVGCGTKKSCAILEKRTVKKNSNCSKS